MRFSDGFLRQVRERASIADYAAKKLVFDKRKSQPAKGDYWACCPFHGEKTASFHIRDDRNVYHCFGCGESGSVIDLAMKLEGLSFPEAVTRLADFAGVPLPVDDRADEGDSKRRRRLYDAAAACAALYRQALLGPEGRAARAYLEGRGLGEDLWARFGIGYAPGGWTFALERLTAQGFKLDELAEAGLAWPGEAGKRAYDVFRERVTFEIADAGGKVIAFGGRTMKADEPAKYLNSPECALFHKGKTLYRLKNAREILAKSKAGGFVVAEGYLDVIAFERAGIAAVAPLGTALTEDQLQLAWRSGGEPVLCFDGDGAGIRASHRALDLALAHLAPGRTVRIAHAAAGQDPDDLYRAGGQEALSSLVSGAASAVDALFARERDAKPLTTPEARADFKKRLRAAANSIQDGDTKALYLKELLARADAALAPPPRKFTPAAGPRGRFAPPAGPTPELKSVALPRRSLEVERLLRMACDRPALLERGADILAQLKLPDPLLDHIRTALLDAWFSHETVDRTALSRHLQRIGDDGRAQRLVAGWPPPKPLDAAVEQEWMALVTLDLAAPAIDAETKALRDRLESEEDALAKAQSLLRDRRAQRESIRPLDDAHPVDDLH